MKALKGKTLMSLIYAMCLSIPLVSILSRVIYVQTNKNAYQSYYGETINQVINNDITYEDLQVNEYYLLVTDTTLYSFDRIQIDTDYCYNYNTNTEYTNITSIQISSGSTTDYLALYNNGTYVTAWELSTVNVYTIKFKYLGGQRLNLLPYQLKDITYNQYSYLDNVFDYSVSKLVDENNFGQLNFFSWFDNLLLTDAQQNMLYVRFVNWYLNYALLVSLMQILFLCLMWFVNFSRKLLDRGMNYDW